MMFYDPQHPTVEQCRALLAADDTLLVMDPSVIENEPERFADLPCPVCVLSESNTPVTDATVEAGIARQIFIADWVQHLPTPSQHGLGMSIANVR